MIVKNHPHRTGGFSLVEVMVVVAILAVVSAGIMTLMSNTFKTQRGIQAKDQQREAIAEVRNFLNNKQACLFTMGGRVANTTFTLPAIRNAVNAPVIPAGSTDKSGLLVYSSFTIQDFVQDPVIPSQAQVNLTVAFAKQGEVIGVKELKEKIAIKIKKDAANLITECFSLGIATEGLWQVSPSNASNIYYGGGNVGIGMNDPTEALEVNGNVLANTYLWTSDLNMKDIQGKSKGLSALNDIHGYKFKWKKDGKVDYGIIAQEVEKQFPELVKTSDDGTKHVNYLGLVAPLIESIHQLKQEQIKLKKEIEALKKEK